MIFRLHSALAASGRGLDFGILLYKGPNIGLLNCHLKAVLSHGLCIP
jgi:hypothetical protein